MSLQFAPSSVVQLQVRSATMARYSAASSVLSVDAGDGFVVAVLPAVVTVVALKLD